MRGVSARIAPPASAKDWRTLAFRAGVAALRPARVDADADRALSLALKGKRGESFVSASAHGRAAAVCLVAATRAYLDCGATGREALAPLLKAAAQTVEDALGAAMATRADVDG